ncbi:MAG: polysaccharide pyruvyl transferase family protein, partial [Terrimicrobiaceae bacterium]
RGGSESSFRDVTHYTYSAPTVYLGESQEMQTAIVQRTVAVGFSAAESKWIIARCAVFAGARTHSTIASLSSCVPTLSIGYSLKARGINQDIFGNLDYCVSGKELDASDFCKRIIDMLARETAIRELLRNCIPQFKDAAFRAGPLLRQILKNAHTA